MFYIFFAIICGLWLIYAWRDQDRTILMVPLFFPAYLVRFSLGVPFNVLEIFVYLLFLVFLLRRKIDWARPILKKFTWPVSLFLVAATIGVFVAPKELVLIDGTMVAAQKMALGMWKGWIVMPILYFFMVTQLKKRAETHDIVMNALEVSGVFLSLWALYQVFNQSYNTPDGRASGPFSSANYLALYLAPIFMYVVIQLVFTEEKSLWHKFLALTRQVIRPRFKHMENYFYAISFAVIGLALFFSQSYSAWLALLAGFIFFYIFYDGKIGYEKLIGLLAMMVVFLGILATQMNQPKWQSWLQFGQRSSSSVRLEVWQVATEFIRQSPILGIGLGQFSYQYNLQVANVLHRAPLEWEMLHPHNVFLMFWLSTGILGLASFIWIFKIAFGFLKKKYSGERRRLVVTSLAMIVVMVVHGLFDTSICKNDLFMEWWLVVGSLGWIE